MQIWYMNDELDARKNSILMCRSDFSSSPSRRYLLKVLAISLDAEGLDSSTRRYSCAPIHAVEMCVCSLVLRSKVSSKQGFSVGRIIRAHRWQMHAMMSRKSEG
jgi:hypothetical protein